MLSRSTKEKLLLFFSSLESYFIIKSFTTAEGAVVFNELCALLEDGQVINQKGNVISWILYL